MNNRYSKFTILISNINKYINKIKTMEMQEFGLRAVHVSCLFYLNKSSDGMTASELCALCEEDKALISRSLDDLESKNMVQYNGDIKSRKYRAKIYLTSKGKEVAEKITQITDYAVEIGSSGISIEERESLYKSLDIICNNLKKKCNSYGEK